MSKKKTFEEFLIEAKKKHPNSGYIYDETTYINTHIPMRIVCPKHGEFWQQPRTHLLYECKACSYEKRGKRNMLTTEQFIEKATQKHGNSKYNYSKSVYCGTKVPICIICPKHGEFWQTPNDHLSGKGCPKCNESQLERDVEKYLIEHNISYIPQYKTDWLGRQSLDFYLTDYNIAIECQGKQHFGVGGWSSNFDFLLLKGLDEKKLKLCNEHNIKVFYLVKKSDKSYISDNILYKDSIYFDIKTLFECIQKSK